MMLSKCRVGLSFSVNSFWELSPDAARGLSSRLIPNLVKMTILTNLVVKSYRVKTRCTAGLVSRQRIVSHRLYREEMGKGIFFRSIVVC